MALTRIDPYSELSDSTLPALSTAYPESIEGGILSKLTETVLESTW